MSRGSVSRRSLAACSLTMAAARGARRARVQPAGLRSPSRLRSGTPAAGPGSAGRRARSSAVPSGDGLAEMPRVPASRCHVGSHGRGRRRAPASFSSPAACAISPHRVHREGQLPSHPRIPVHQALAVRAALVVADRGQARFPPRAQQPRRRPRARRSGQIAFRASTTRLGSQAHGRGAAWSPGDPRATRRSDPATRLGSDRIAHAHEVTWPDRLDVRMPVEGGYSQPAPRHMTRSRDRALGGADPTTLAAPASW